jgi:hypothetical protein
MKERGREGERERERERESTREREREREREAYKTNHLGDLQWGSEGEDKATSLGSPDSKVY